MNIDKKHLVVVALAAAACGLGGAGIAQAEQPAPGCNEWVDSWKNAVPDWATEHHNRLSGWCEDQFEGDPPSRQGDGEDGRTIPMG